jgi:thiol-disulfide isomerase/thioredoxin
LFKRQISEKSRPRRLWAVFFGYDNHKKNTLTDWRLPNLRDIAIRLLMVVMIVGVILPSPAQALNVGDTLKLGSITLMDGKVLTAADLAGKHVVLQIWASWCPYCHRQNLNLIQLARDTKGGNLVVLGVSIDKDPKAAAQYVQKHGLNFPVAMITPELDRAIGKRKGIPELYVLDPKGKVLQKDFGEMIDLDVFELDRFSK